MGIYSHFRVWSFYPNRKQCNMQRIEISIDSGYCGSIIFLLIKLKIQTRSNDRFGLKLGTVRAQLGQRACPSWARCLPLLGRFGFQYLPIYGVQPMHAIPAIWQFLSSANHPDGISLISKPSRQLPDNRQTVNYLFVRILQQKTRQSDSFDDFPWFICKSQLFFRILQKQP